MLKEAQILVRAIILAAGAVVLAGCGQKGALYLPTEAAARQRATLPQTVRPGWTRAGGATAPAAAAVPAAPGNAAPPTPTDQVPESSLQE